MEAELQHCTQVQQVDSSIEKREQNFAPTGILTQDLLTAKS